VRAGGQADFSRQVSAVPRAIVSVGPKACRSFSCRGLFDLVVSACANSEAKYERKPQFQHQLL
jgi:hypothetical protein